VTLGCLEMLREGREFFEETLDTVVVLGDFSVKLEVFLLQWGGLFLRCPLGRSEVRHGISSGQAQQVLFTSG
jgi:hypothetical protein